MDRGGRHRDLLEPARPTLDLLQLMRLLQLRLEGLALASAVASIEFEALGLRASQTQIELFRVQRRRDLDAGTEALAQVPPVRHAVVRTNPVNRRRNFYAGGHAARIVGWSETASRRLLDNLLERATRPEFVYAHQWRQFDFVIWDNRCVLHRATPFASDRHRRDMRRTTVAGSGPTVNDAGEALPTA